MKHFTIFLLLLAATVSVVIAQTDDHLPFQIELEEVQWPSAPTLHSFAFAQSGGKWLFIGGRTNGLHGFFPNTAFPRESANSDVWVIDPTTGTSWSASLYTLPTTITDPLRSTNMQSYQEGERLYIIGGYGMDTAGRKMVTFTTLTAVDVPGMIDAVVNGTSIASYIHQTTDDRMGVCGGELEKLGDYFYLAFGHTFSGIYSRDNTKLFTQEYSNRIRKFKIMEEGDTPSIIDYSEISDPDEFHRRDLNLVPSIRADGSPRIAAYGGVFRPDRDQPYLHPIYIDETGVSVDKSYEQVMSQYTCAVLPMADAGSTKMYTTFFGGISLHTRNKISGALEIDTLMPFVDDVTTMTTDPDGTLQETVLSTTLPGLLGANAEFIIAPDVPQYENRVVRLDRLEGRTLVGHIFGGIKAVIPNITPSSASDKVFKVYVTPVNSSPVRTTSASGEGLHGNYPNPLGTRTTIEFSIAGREHARLSVFDPLGNELAVLVDQQMEAGRYRIDWNATTAANGIYLYRLRTERSSETGYMIVQK